MKQLYFKIKSSKVLCLIMLVLALLCFETSYAQRIRVQGVVKSSSGTPIYNAYVVDNGVMLATTDADGKFSISISPSGSVTVFAIGFSETNVSIDNRQTLDIVLSELSVNIEEVVLTVDAPKRKMLIDQTEVEIIGNYFHLRTKFRVPKKVFSGNTRLVVQPIIRDKTVQKNLLMHPVVIDGAKYALTQERMHDFDMTNDSLHHWIIENRLKADEYIVVYHDSIYVDRKMRDHAYDAKCDVSIENYSKIMMSDSVVIAKGTQNIMRFFNVGLDAVPITDTAYIPKPEMQLMDDSGSSKISFVLVRAEIDSSNPENQVEIDKIVARMQEIQNDEFTTIQSIDICGVASPEGSLSVNQRLARQRTEVVRDLLTNTVGGGAKFIKWNVDSRVEPWSAVVKLMNEVDDKDLVQVRDIVDNNRDDYARCQTQIFADKELIAKLKDEYLPKLRKVDYTINYSLFRKLSDSEIRDKYRKGDTEFTRYEFYRLIDTESNPAEIEKMMDMALKSYPNFTLFANIKAVDILRNDKEPDLSILEPSMQLNPPYEVIYNQTLMALKAEDYELADKLSARISMDGRSEFIRAVISAKMGYYKEAYPVLSQKGGLNEVLLLLGMKRNKEAFIKITTLLHQPENVTNAQMWYVRAVSANRLDDLLEAMESLSTALQLDPSLQATAQNDSDVMDLLEIIKTAAEYETE